MNTGCREQEVCKLQWDLEIRVPELGTSVFLIPADFGGRSEKSGVKNGDERLVVLNKVAMSVIDGQRGLHSKYVFPYGQPDEHRPTAMHRINDTAWKKARVRAAAKWDGTQVTGTPWVQIDQDSRPQAHLWQKASCSGRDTGGSEGALRAQEWQRYELLFYRRAGAVDYGGEQSVGNRFARTGADHLEEKNCSGMHC